MLYYLMYLPMERIIIIIITLHVRNVMAETCQRAHLGVQVEAGNDLYSQQVLLDNN